jgi:hypothetical protein
MHIRSGIALPSSRHDIVVEEITDPLPSPRDLEADSQHLGRMLLALPVADPGIR